MELVIELAGRYASICEWRPLAGTSRWLNAIFAPLVARSPGPINVADRLVFVNDRIYPKEFLRLHLGYELGRKLFGELNYRRAWLVSVARHVRNYNTPYESQLFSDTQDVESAIRIPLDIRSRFRDSVGDAKCRFEKKYRFM